MNAATQTTGWWRRQGRYLLGAVLLGAWALYVPYRQAWQRYARLHALVPLAAARGAWVSYEGARWRLLDIAAHDHPDLSKEAVVVIARFESIIESGTDAKKIERCRGRLGDAQGHLWEHDSSALPRAQRKPDSCAPSSVFDTQAGGAWQFEFTFLVPRGTDVRGLHPQIFIPWADENASGTYLRFDP